jgi:hypothetical protein
MPYSSCLCYTSRTHFGVFWLGFLAEFYQRFRVCDAVDRGGNALHFVLLWVLVPDERVMGMFQLFDVCW